MSNGITGLLKIELPSHTVLLSDGGVTEYDGDTYSAVDSVLGSLASIDTIAEGIGQEIPAVDYSFAPPGITAVTALSSGAIQQSRVTQVIVDYDPETGEVLPLSAETRFRGFVDQPQVAFEFRQFSVNITCVPELEKMFFSDAMSLGATQHKLLYPDELGHDNASGLSVPVAWGVNSPPRGGTTFGGGGSGAWGGGVYSPSDLVAR